MRQAPRAQLPSCLATTCPLSSAQLNSPQVLVRKGRAQHVTGRKLKVGDKVFHADILLDGEALDPPAPLVVALHKPVGYVVTTPDDENIPDPKVYDLLPYR